MTLTAYSPEAAIVATDRRWTFRKGASVEYWDLGDRLLRVGNAFVACSGSGAFWRVAAPRLKALPRTSTPADIAAELCAIAHTRPRDCTTVVPMVALEDGAPRAFVWRCAGLEVLWGATYPEDLDAEDVPADLHDNLKAVWDTFEVQGHGPRASVRGPGDSITRGSSAIPEPGSFVWVQDRLVMW